MWFVEDVLHRLAPFLIASLLVGCANGTWSVTAWGEEYIEDGIPAADFADGCSATYTQFETEFTLATLLEVDDTVVAEASPVRIDLVQPGPHDIGAIQVPAGQYERVFYRIGPDGSDAVRAAGSVTCGSDTITFDWSFDTEALYRCLPLDIAIGGNETASTELTIHGDHLFFDGLAEDGPEPRGQAIVDADADEDGTVTLEELAAVDVSAIGYDVDIFTDVTDLRAFVTHHVQGVGHVDGEGHCFVERQ